MNDGSSDTQYHFLVAILDSSHLLTFVISLLLIIYGSFRGISLENERLEKEKNKENGVCKESSMLSSHTIESSEAICFPLAASASLLFMFFLFDSLQMVFAMLMAVLATMACSFLLLPACIFVLGLCFNPHRRLTFPLVGCFTSAELLSLVSSFYIVLLWVFTGNWLLMDTLSMALSTTMIALVQVPSLKVSVLLMVGLLVYDVFWVFLSERIFSVNVMVNVATRQASNPVSFLTNQLNIENVVHPPNLLSLPATIMFPSSKHEGQFSILGLGDIVVPGLLLCFLLRFDYHKNVLNNGSTSKFKPIYFMFSLVGYLLGLIAATVASDIYHVAQPALLYLVPFTVLPLVIQAYLKGDLQAMWNYPVSISSKHPASISSKHPASISLKHII